MCSASHKVSLLVVFLICGIARAEDAPRVLRVCSDPNNLPFSNDKLEGFENRIADVIARDLGMKVEYTWRAQRRGFMRESLKNGNCDIVIGVPRQMEMCLTSTPYYRSSYAFVSPRQKQLKIKSLDDPRLANLKVGVQVGIESATPPAQALARRGIVTNLVGYTIVGNYLEPNPPAAIVDAVANGDVDVALVWGPLAGYFAKKQSVPLDVVAVEPSESDANLPMTFDICVGVRRTEKSLRDRINQILARRQSEIDRILDEYGVPRLPITEQSKPEEVK